MPNIIHWLPETYLDVTRPVAHSVARQLLRTMGFPEDVYLQFVGPAEQAAQQGSTLTANVTRNLYGTNTQINIVISEDFIGERTFESSVMRRDNVPYFRDENLFVYVRSVLAPTECTVSFRIRTKDENEAIRWRDDIRARQGMMRGEQVLKADYHHPVPDEFLVILKEIHRLREAQFGYGQDYDSWMEQCLDDRATILTNLAGKRPMLAIAETQVEILGGFDFSGLPDKPVADANTGTYTVEFNYRYQYDRPYMAAMTYPLLVHQQLLGESFRPKEGDYDLNREYTEPNRTKFLLNQFSRAHNPPSSQYQVARVPEFDTWFPPQVQPPLFKTLFIGLIGLDAADPQMLIDLNQLGDYQLSDGVKAFIKNERQFVTRQYRSLVHLSLYTNDGISSDSELTLDENLVLRSNVPLDMRQVYHVRIALLTDLRALRTEDGERIRQDACNALEIIVWLYPKLFELNVIPIPNKHCDWVPRDWESLINIIPPIGGWRDTFEDPDHQRLRRMLTVEHGIVITRHRSEL